MAEQNVISTLDGLYKVVYADRLERIIPSWAKMQQAVPWSERKKLGRKLETPVVLALEHGVTYGAYEDGPFTLSSPVAGQLKPSTVYAYQHVLRSAIAYDAAFQAEKTGPEAFENATGVLLESMTETIRKRVECDLLGYGRSSLGQVSGAPATDVVTISAASWCPGIWVGSEGAELEVYNGTGASATKRTGAGSAGQYTVVSVDLDNKTITVDDDQNIADGDYIYFRTQRTATAYKAMIGLDTIATTAGTLFGIDNSTYNIFKGISVSAGSTDLSVDTIQKAAAKAVVKGASGKLRCAISPVTWANVCNDLSALVRYDNGGKASSKYVIGADMITVNSPVGQIDIESWPMIKEGEGFIFQPKLFLRCGATDVTFNRNRMAGQLDIPATFFRELTDKAGYEIRCYSSQYLYTHKPGCIVKLTSIVNS